MLDNVETYGGHSGSRCSVQWIKTDVGYCRGDAHVFLSTFCLHNADECLSGKQKPQCAVRIPTFQWKILFESLLHRKKRKKEKKSDSERVAAHLNEGVKRQNLPATKPTKTPKR